MTTQKLFEAIRGVVSYAGRWGGLLGKTKLFKILYLADWATFQETEGRLLDVAWVRLPMGPGLRARDWALVEEQGTHHGIQVIEQVSRYDPELLEYSFHLLGPESSRLSGPGAVNVANYTKALLQLTAVQAANLTYETEPMRWIVAREKVLGEDWMNRVVDFRDPEREQFYQMANAYEAGDLPLADLCQKAGYPEWVILSLLDILGFARPRRPLSHATRRAILRRIARDWDRRQGRLKASIVKAALEAAHSQRMEGIYMDPQALAASVRKSVRHAR